MNKLQDFAALVLDMFVTKLLLAQQSLRLEKKNNVDLESLEFFYVSG